MWVRIPQGVANSVGETRTTRRLEAHAYNAKAGDYSERILDKVIVLCYNENNEGL